MHAAVSNLVLSTARVSVVRTRVLLLVPVAVSSFTLLHRGEGGVRMEEGSEGRGGEDEAGVGEAREYGLMYAWVGGVLL